MSRLSLSILFLAFLGFLGCRGDIRNHSSVLYTGSDSVAVNIVHRDQNMDRAIWQKPSLVIEKLGDISQATIADVGAGTGYFSFKLGQKASNVIAIDIEQAALNYIDSLKSASRGNVGENVQTRLAKSDNPNLKPDEVDIVVIINTIGYIKDLPDYFKKLKVALKKGGRIMIIDYKMKKLPINAPSKEFRVYLDKVEDYLDDAGFRLVETDDTSLDYQYVVIGMKK